MAGQGQLPGRPRQAALTSALLRLSSLNFFHGAAVCVLGPPACTCRASFGPWRTCSQTPKGPRGPSGGGDLGEGAEHMPRSSQASSNQKSGKLLLRAVTSPVLQRLSYPVMAPGPP